MRSCCFKHSTGVVCGGSNRIVPWIKKLTDFCKNQSNFAKIGEIGGDGFTVFFRTRDSCVVVVSSIQLASYVVVQTGLYHGLKN
jgi:hypothetical protein